MPEAPAATLSPDCFRKSARRVSLSRFTSAASAG